MIALASSERTVRAFVLVVGLSGVLLASALSGEPPATNALVTGAYDGDTLSVEADIWPNLVWTGSVRVVGVDTPEIKGGCEAEKDLAIKARDYVRTLLTGKSVRLTEVENGKYGGRVVARVYFLEEGSWINLADRLITRKLGRAYASGARENWCANE